jgi:hypothetical protein
MDLDTKKRSWWVRRAVLHLMSHRCWDGICFCIPCDQLKEAKELFPKEYEEAVKIYSQTRVARNGIA